MDWNLEEAVAYYKRQGAPGDQTALINLLRETQQENGGGIPGWMVGRIAAGLGVKESYLLAVVKRIPSLRLENTHTLQLCAGPNCGRAAALAALAEELHKKDPTAFILQYSGCMRMCGKGPNLKWDGTLYNKADEALLRSLTAPNGFPRGEAVAKIGTSEPILATDEECG